MPKHALYIPTKARERYAAKCARSLSRINPGYPIYVTTERQHVPALHLALRMEADKNGPLGATILPIDFRNIGIGATRQHILLHAAKFRYDSIAMIDDDQDMTGDIEKWLWTATRDDICGVQAWKPYYGLLYGKTSVWEWVKAKKPPALFGCTGAQGPMAFAVNVIKAISIGGFDGWARCWEDAEFIRRTIWYGRPWWVYTGAVALDFAPQKELRKPGMGGMAAPGACDEGRESIHPLCYDRWPKYVSKPMARYSCQWKKLYKDRCPEFLPTWPPQNTLSIDPWDWKA